MKKLKLLHYGVLSLYFTWPASSLCSLNNMSYLLWGLICSKKFELTLTTLKSSEAKNKNRFKKVSPLSRFPLLSFLLQLLSFVKLLRRKK